MPLNIKDPETHALAKRLASLTGESLTRAVKLAIQQRLAQVEKTQRATTRLADELDDIALHCERSLVMTSGVFRSEGT